MGATIIANQFINDERARQLGRLANQPFDGLFKPIDETAVHKVKVTISAKLAPVQEPGKDLAASYTEDKIEHIYTWKNPPESSKEDVDTVLWASWQEFSEKICSRLARDLRLLEGSLVYIDTETRLQVSTIDKENGNESTTADYIDEHRIWNQPISKL